MVPTPVERANFQTGPLGTRMSRWNLGSMVSNLVSKFVITYPPCKLTNRWLENSHHF